MYTELHARSAFSFLEGASVPEELAAACSAHEMSGMAGVDRDGVYKSRSELRSSSRPPVASKW